MNATQYVVPAVLRGAMFVPRQAPGRREPARVTPGAFKSLTGKAVLASRLRVVCRGGRVVRLCCSVSHGEILNLGRSRAEQPVTRGAFSQGFLRVEASLCEGSR